MRATVTDGGGRSPLAFGDVEPMKRCVYCGKEYPDDVSVCLIDEQAVEDDVCRSHTEARRFKGFFHWKPVSISLIVLIVVYWGVALLNLWLIYMRNERGDTRNVSFLLWGAFWNVVVGAFCFAGRHFMKRGSRVDYVVGAIAVSVAMFLVLRTWLGGLLTGRNPFPVVEALLVWPWLIYAVAYAMKGIKRQANAEPSAAPNGSPAARVGNSGVTEGPPSVS